MNPMVPKVSQESFVANPKNKNRLITLLKFKFAAVNIICEQAHEDADTTIINKALNLAIKHDSVVVIGEDIILVILVGCYSNPNVYFLKFGKGNVR